jgi:calcium-dependent protein kinase
VLEDTDHPNITRVFELMEDAKNYFVVMEFCSGGNLLEKIIERKSISEKVAADII